MASYFTRAYFAVQIYLRGENCMCAYVLVQQLNNELKAKSRCSYNPVKIGSACMRRLNYLCYNEPLFLCGVRGICQR